MVSGVPVDRPLSELGFSVAGQDDRVVGHGRRVVNGQPGAAVVDDEYLDRVGSARAGTGRHAGIGVGVRCR